MIISNCHEFKIGDKVSYKGCDKLLGYVSNIDKGNLFRLDVFKINVHLGNKKHIVVNDSDLCIYNK